MKPVYSFLSKIEKNISNEFEKNGYVIFDIKTKIFKEN